MWHWADAAQARLPLPCRFDVVGGAETVALTDGAAQRSLCGVASFDKHLVFRQAKRIAHQPHAESLDLALRA
jgi:hypothetical protein